MKKHLVIPVLYGKMYINKDIGWFGKEIYADGFNDEKNKDLLKGLYGTLAIEVLLDAGWNIITVQTAQIPAYDNNPGGVLFHYILESPEMD